MNKNISENKNIKHYKNTIERFTDIPNTHQKLICKLLNTFFNKKDYIVKCKYMDIDCFFDITNINLKYLPEEILFENVNLSQQISIPINENFNEFFKKINKFIKIYKLIDNNTLCENKENKKQNINNLDILDLD